MKIAVVHDRVIAGRPDSEDLLEEIAVVTEALDGLGHTHECFPVDDAPSGLNRLLSRLLSFSADAVFNLVEAHGRGQRLFPAVCGALELAVFPFTGSPYDALLMSTNKIVAKSVMKAVGIPTPRWHVYDGSNMPPVGQDCTYIVKPSCEDASVGIDDSSVFTDTERLLASLPETYAAHRQPLLIEEFIDGRELNISMIEHGDVEPEVFPVAEILFQNWPEGKPAIVNYNAKWLPETFEYANTPRRFNPEGINTALLGETALKCWQTFGLKGYARVDVRVGRDGLIYVIELNANPCIAHESGYMSAAAEAGYSETDVVRTLIEAALRR